MIRGRRPFTSPRVRREKRKKALIKAGFDIALLISVAVLVSQILLIPEITIRDIEVQGTEVLSQDEIREIAHEAVSGKYLYLFSKENTLILPRKQIGRDILNAFTRARDVDVSVEDFNTILVTVSEREPFALWCGEAPVDDEPIEEEEMTEESETEKKIERTGTSECYLLDENGFVFASAPDFSEGVYLKYYGSLDLREKETPEGQQFLTTEKFSSISNAVNAFSERGLKVQEIVFENDNVEAFLENGGRILFNDTEHFDGVVENLSSVLASEEFLVEEGEEIPSFEYIDLRFGNKVFFKPE